MFPEKYSEKLRTSKGGGVGIFKRTKENAVMMPLSRQNIECIALKVTDYKIILMVVYRPSVLPANEFLLGLEKVVKSISLPGYQYIILGDFNEDARLTGLIQTFMLEKGFTQLVNFPTTEGQTVQVYTTCPQQLEVLKLPTYFSYHEAVLVVLKQ